MISSHRVFCKTDRMYNIHSPESRDGQIVLHMCELSETHSSAVSTICGVTPQRKGLRNRAYPVQLCSLLHWKPCGMVLQDRGSQGPQATRWREVRLQPGKAKSASQRPAEGSQENRGLKDDDIFTTQSVQAAGAEEGRACGRSLEKTRSLTSKL